jgi:hypothetical protein
MEEKPVQSVNEARTMIDKKFPHLGASLYDIARHKGN